MQKKIEKNALIVSFIMNFIIAASGIFVYLLTGLQALFLDGVFSLIAFISNILATVISKVSRRKTKSYPNGLHFLEPFYAILKSLFILLLLGTSLAETSKTAYNYFFYGTGEIMNIGPVLPYSIAMVILCFGLGLFNKYQNKRINNTSTILTAESKGNFVDGIQTLGIGIAAVLLYFIDINGSLGFLWYTGDFFITAVLVIISIKEPITVLINSFREISKGITADKDILSFINGKVEEIVHPITKDICCEIVKVGMYIDIKIYLNENITQDMYSELMKAKENIYSEVSQKYENINIIYAF